MKAGKEGGLGGERTGLAAGMSGKRGAAPKKAAAKKAAGKKTAKKR